MTFDEWFHKEYEPADLQIKQYAERNEGLHIPAKVYLEDLKKAYEAGLHADVHTDNSKVIAELEKKIKKNQDDIDCLTLACENYREEMEKNLANATELEKENAELKEMLEITDLALDNCLKDSEVVK
jgi:hypothetical protein